MSIIKTMMNAFPYVTFKKLANLVTITFEYKTRKVKLKGLPYSYYVDIGNVCNLKCPLCPTGLNSNKRKKQLMDFATYKKIFDKIKDYSFKVDLYNWGEPFLNKDLLKIIEYTKKNKVGIVLSSNFNIVTEEMIEVIVKLKLDKLVVSLDGADESSYLSYRRGGSFDAVMSNLKKLVLKKKEQNSKKPEVVWQYLINKKNEAGVDKAKELAREMGVKIEFGKFQISQEVVRKGVKIDKKLVDEWIPDDLKEDPANYLFVASPPCGFLYHRMVINPEGTVSPCCAVYDSKTDFGNILNDSLEDVWNNPKFLSARSLFSKRLLEDKKVTVCDSCVSILGEDYFKKY